MTTTREQLKEAYRLIRHDQPHEAEQLLRPILEADPGNVHAWWLLAYSVDNPSEVRDALNKVLTLDPEYSNAPKAREMLATLEEVFFAPETERDASMTPFIGDDVTDAESLTVEKAEVAFSTTYEDIHGPGYDDNYGVPADSLYLSDDTIFDDFDDTLFEHDDLSEADLFGLDGDTEPGRERETESGVYPLDGIEDSALSEEDKAAAEERFGRRAGRRGCVRTAVVMALLLAVVVIGVILLTRQEDVSADPGKLVVMTTESEPIASAIAAAELDVTSAALGAQPHIVLAESPLGDTLFVEFCGDSSSDFDQEIALAMQIAAQQAVSISDSLDAVGVSVNRCDTTPHDTLYRAFVPVADAVSYLNGDFGAAQVGWAEFQQRWQQS